MTEPGRTSGPEVEFAAFVAARQTALLRTAYLLTGHPQDAEDLVQVALVKAVPAWRRIAGDPEAYVRRILVRENISRWRRRRWREVLLDRPVEPVADDPDAATRVTLQQALGRLAPRQRAVIVLRYLEDLSQEETADVLGVAVGTVRSQSRDGLARLRALVPDLLPGAEEKNLGDAPLRRDPSGRTPG